MQRISITSEQMAEGTISIKTGRGKPAKIDGKPIWEVIEGDSVKVRTSASGLTGRIIANDEFTSGISIVRITADADLGEGVEPISTDIEVEVTSPKAESIESTFKASDKIDEDPKDPGEEDEEESGDTE